MSALSTSTAAESGSDRRGVRLGAAEIDASCRWVLLPFFLSGVLWLMLGTLASLIVAIKLHKADFLADCACLTLGRLRPAANNSFIYGFASQVGMGVSLWLLCRLGGVRLMYQWPLYVACKLWNLGVAVGVVAILAGASTGFELLEMPRYAAGMLFIAFALFGLCAVATFAARRERELFPSQWYLLAALFWFPWIYSAANYLLVLDPVRGSFQAVVNAWYTGNLGGLWLGSIAIAAIFYFLPKQTGQPLYSREMAAFGFWTLAFFTSFSGLIGLISGPVPRWMPSVSTAAAVCLLVPLLSHGLNWHLTNAGNCCAWKKDHVLRFVLFGAACYLVHGLAGVLVAFPSVSATTQFTYAVPARQHLFLHGFIGMVLFGSLYYILPRLLQVEWPSQKSIRIHFSCTVAGVALLFVALTFGGILQGRNLADPSVPFLTVVRKTIPFVGLSTLGMLLLLIGQVAFVSNLAGMLRGFLSPLARSWCGELCGGGGAARAEVKS